MAESLLSTEWVIWKAAVITLLTGKMEILLTSRVSPVLHIHRALCSDFKEKASGISSPFSFAHKRQGVDDFGSSSIWIKKDIETLHIYCYNLQTLQGHKHGNPNCSFVKCQLYTASHRWVISVTPYWGFHPKAIVADTTRKHAKDRGTSTNQNVAVWINWYSALSDSHSLEATADYMLKDENVPVYARDTDNGH